MNDEVAVHPSADVEAGAVLGAGTRVWRWTHVRAGAVIGARCSIGQGCYVAEGAVIGDDCRLQNGVYIWSGVTLEDGVFVGPNATFTNIRTPRARFPRKGTEPYAETRVGHDATLGANCTVVCGVTIGAYALVAAGAVVTRDVPEHALVRGVPAVVAGWVCACGRVVTAQDTWGCTECGAAVVPLVGSLPKELLS